MAVLVLVTSIVAGCANASSSQGASPTPAASTAASSSSVAAPTASPAAGPAFVGTKYPSQGHTHLVPGEPDDFVYNSNPPTSGPHREMFSDAFVNAASLPVYVQVHLLEHGNVLLQYSCICPDVAAALIKIAMRYNQQFLTAGETQATTAQVQNAEDQGKAVVVAPYPRMQERIAITAWTHLGVLPKVDEAKIESFIDAHLGNPAE